MMVSPSALHSLLRLDTRDKETRELFLITSVLGAAASWVAQAITQDILRTGGSVVFVSLIHNQAFHQGCLKRRGVDLGVYTQKGKFAFVDGLCTLVPSQAVEDDSSLDTLPNDRFTLRKLSAEITSTVKRLCEQEDNDSNHSPVLILENIDFLLACAEASTSELVAEMEDWHDVVSSTFAMVCADSAFMQNPQTRLELEQASFVTTLAHQASVVIGLRLLDTGIARDISGVLRITERDKHGKACARRGFGNGEKEMLYLVGDGAVEVFNRGEFRS